MTTSSEESTTTVRVLLDVAGIEVSAAELAQLAEAYPAMRAGADALYRLDLEPESPAPHFDPTVGYA